MKYYAFVDFNVDFFVNLFENNYDILKGYIDLVKEGIMKLIKFLKDNPVPPKLFPSKTLTMHKKIQTNFPNKVNQLTIKNFEERYNNISKEKRERLGEIWKSKVV